MPEMTDAERLLYLERVVFVQMRQSGAANTVTYEVIDKRRAKADWLVSTFAGEAEANALAASLRGQ